MDYDDFFVKNDLWILSNQELDLLWIDGKIRYIYITYDSLSPFHNEEIDTELQD